MTDERRFTLTTIALVVATIALAAAGVWLVGKPKDHDAYRTWAIFGTLALMALGWLADFRKYKTFGRTITAVLVILAVITMAAELGGGTKGLIKKGRINSWNAFHYVIGTKFFGEIGYHDFYNAAVLADSEGTHRFKKVRTVRDLQTYEHIRVTRAISQARKAGVRERFTDERWAEFQGDLAAMGKHRASKRWQGPLNDLGFHPSPAWLILHMPLLNAVDIQDETTLSALCGLDLLLIVLTIAALWWGFGLRTAAVSTLWLHLYFGNSTLMVGGYFHYDWMFWTILAAALYRKEKFLAAGAVLAYPAMMRGYPGLLALGPGICVARALVTRHRPERKHVAFVVALVLSCGLIVGLSSATRHGPSAWLDWKEKISKHASIHPTGRQRIGLEFLYAHDFEQFGWTIPKKMRPMILDHNQGKFRTMKVLLLALFGLALIGRRDEDGMLLALGVVLVMMVLSRYYHSVWLLMFTMLPTDRARIGNLLAAMGFFGLLLIYYLVDGTSEMHRYHMYNVGLLIYFAALAVAFLGYDLGRLAVKFRAS